MSRRLLEEHINFEQEEKEIQIRGEIITTSPSRSGSQILMLVTSLAFGAGCKVGFWYETKTHQLTMHMNQLE